MFYKDTHPKCEFGGRTGFNCRTLAPNISLNLFSRAENHVGNGTDVVLCKNENALQESFVRLLDSQKTQSDHMYDNTVLNPLHKNVALNEVAGPMLWCIFTTL